MDEVIFVDKPAGMTSFGAVARVRRILSERAGRKIKVGHTGTLDPFATGLLILMAGKATKRAMSFTKQLFGLARLLARAILRAKLSYSKQTRGLS